MESLIRNRLLLVAFAAPMFASGQGMEGADAASNFSESNTHMFRSFDNRYEGVRGVPTWLEEFTEGSVVLKNGAVAKKVDLNLDITTGDLLLRSQKTNTVLVVQTRQVKSFVLPDAPGGPTEFINVDGLGYCEKVYDGQVKLYLKHTKYIEKANYGGAYNANGRRYDEFVALDKYYLLQESSSPEEVKLSRKTFEKAFPGKSAEIRTYFKERTPDLKNPKDVAELMGYLEGNKPANQ